MSRTTVAYHELLHGYEWISAGAPQEAAAYISRATGMVYIDNGDEADEVPHDAGDPQFYIAIPHAQELNLGKALVLRFVQINLPQHLPLVQSLFGHPGGYAKVKELLARRQLLDRWHDFETEHTHSALMGWCRDQGIHVST